MYGLASESVLFFASVHFEGWISIDQRNLLPYCACKDVSRGLGSRSEEVLEYPRGKCVLISLTDRYSFHQHAYKYDKPFSQRCSFFTASKRMPSKHVLTETPYPGPPSPTSGFRTVIGVWRRFGPSLSIDESSVLSKAGRRGRVRRRRVREPHPRHRRMKENMKPLNPLVLRPSAISAGGGGVGRCSHKYFLL